MGRAIRVASEQQAAISPARAARHASFAGICVHCSRRACRAPILYTIPCSILVRERVRLQDRLRRFNKVAFLFKVSPRKKRGGRARLRSSKDQNDVTPRSHRSAQVKVTVLISGKGAQRMLKTLMILTITDDVCSRLVAL
jgi:hypothetical protein